MISLAVALLVIALDQLSKFIVRNSLIPQRPVTIIKGFFSITYVRNPGGAFGLFPNQQWLFLVVALLVVATIIIFFLRNQPRDLLTRIALGLAAGGAVGNLIDRVLFGKVTDFLDIHIWPVFNLADGAILLGMSMLVYILLRRSPKEPEPR